MRLLRGGTNTGVRIGVAQVLETFSGMALFEAEACLGLLKRGLCPGFVLHREVGPPGTMGLT
jgi:hypothetical protein